MCCVPLQFSFPFSHFLHIYSIEQVAALEEQCEHEKETCTTLEGCQKSHKLLVQAEELSDLDERIEGLDAQAEYVALSIAEQERKIQEGLNTKFDFLPFSPFS